MKKSFTAILLSALVYPGVGHFFLKKTYRGILFSGIASICLYFLLLKVVVLSQEVANKILNGEIEPDLVSISETILNLLDESGVHQLNTVTLILILCWLIALVDSYRLGRKSDSEN
jgi:TM2 domain-containing membrane protein YozV